jgi:hypothetical protein
VTCGCPGPVPRGPVLTEAFLVPRQTTYPAIFLAEATTTRLGKPYWQYLVIGRQSAGSNWKVVDDPDYLGSGPLVQPVTGPGGFDTASPPPLATNRYPSELAAYWQSFALTGHAPRQSELAPGAWTSQAPTYVGVQRNGTTWKFNGLVAYQLFHSGGPEELYRFGTATGGLTCGVERLERYWEYPGGNLYQPKSRNNWGPAIAPGLYKAIVSTDIGKPCFIPSRTGGVAVIGGQMTDDTAIGLGREPLPPSN